VIVDELYVVCVGSDPAEADAPLIVDADAVLADPVPGHFLKAVGWRDSEVEEAGCGIEHDELTQGDSLKIGGYSANPLPFE
jgi:hypothetical protein